MGAVSAIPEVLRLPGSRKAVSSASLSSCRMQRRAAGWPLGLPPRRLLAP